MSFYQTSLGDRLQYELRFNDYSRVIIATGDANATYTINNISLKYDSVTQPELARLIRNQYMGRVSILYDRVLRHRKILSNKSDTLINISLNVSARSIKVLLMLPAAGGLPWAHDTESYYKPKITKADVTFEGVPNQIYSQGLHSYHVWEEAKKLFATSPSNKHNPETAAAEKELSGRCNIIIFLGE